MIISIAVDCIWNDWVIGECSRICGNVTQDNTRTKNVTEGNGGSCQGQSIETVSCNTHKCQGKTFI